MTVAPVTDFGSEPLISDEEQTIIEGINSTIAGNRGANEAFPMDDPLVNSDLWKSIHVEVYYKQLIWLGLLRSDAKVELF